MKLRFLLFLLLACLQGFTQSFITSHGRILIDEQGKEVKLKGIGIANWLVPEGYMLNFGNVDSPRKIHDLLNELTGETATKQFWKEYLDNYITKEDILFIRDQGFNHIRLYFHYKMLTEDDYMGENRHGYQYLDSVVNWCEQAGIYVLLDMHAAPCGQSGENYDDSYGYPWLLRSNECQQQMINLWKEIADRYKNRKAVLGYELMNAPIAPHFEADLDTLNQSLRVLHERLVTAIREVDSLHLIFVQFSEYHNNLNVLSPTYADNIVFQFQRYYMEVNQKAIDKFISFSKAHQVPVYLCEAGEREDKWINDMRSLLEENNIGWCFHPYKKMKEPSAVVTIKEPANWKLLQTYEAADRLTYKQIRENRPDQVKVRQALQELITNCTLKNCLVNPSYLEALGLDFKKKTNR